MISHSLLQNEFLQHRLSCMSQTMKWIKSKETSFHVYYATLIDSAETEHRAMYVPVSGIAWLNVAFLKKHFDQSRLMKKRSWQDLVCLPALICQVDSLICLCRRDISTLKDSWNLAAYWQMETFWFRLRKHEATANWCFAALQSRKT